MATIKMGFWNYVEIGKLDTKTAVKDWKEMGMNCPISFRFPLNSTKKAEMLEMLDECQKQGIKVFVDDGRMGAILLKRYGEEEFRKNVMQAIEDFGSHPAVEGFFLGDEPIREWIDIWSRKAAKIVNELTPNLTNYINFFPYWGNPDNEFCNSFQLKEPDDYIDLIKDFVKDTGMKMVSYDYYGQCCYFDKEEYKDIYFQNLRMFGKVAADCNVALYNCPLSVGHLSSRVPTEDDMRWQIATSVAHGVTGFQWFYMYVRDYDSSFRNAPYDEYGNKTETYDYLKRQSRIFMDNFAPKLEEFHFCWAKHFNKAYGGFELFTGDENLISVVSEINETPLIISKFEDSEDGIIMAITNNCQTEPTYIVVELGGKFKSQKHKLWLAPGQMKMFSNKFWL